MTPDYEVIQCLESQMLRAARTLAALNDFTRAADMYREIATSFPNRAVTHRELAVVLLRAAQAAWLPWVKNRLACDAIKEAGRANELESAHGDTLFVITEAMTMVGYDKDVASVIDALEQAFVFFNRQLICGEVVSPFYLDTATRLAKRYEARGQAQAAIMMNRVIADAPTLEEEGKIASGTTKSDAVAKALTAIARLQATERG